MDRRVLGDSDDQAENLGERSMACDKHRSALAHIVRMWFDTFALLLGP
jgi:hypothetical protein